MRSVRLYRAIHDERRRGATNRACRSERCVLSRSRWRCCRAAAAVSSCAKSRRPSTNQHLVYGLYYLAPVTTAWRSTPPLVRATAAAAAAFLSGASVIWLPATCMDTGLRSRSHAEHALSENDADRLIFWGRCHGSLLVLICATVYVWARTLGRAGGLVALVVAVFAPSMLAHGSLITTDVR